MSELSDAEILERAAQIVAPYDDSAEQHSDVSGALRHLAAKLRAAEQPDVFEAFCRRFGRCAATDNACDWFGPLVALADRLSRSACANSMWGLRPEVAAALSALRERARAAQEKA